MKLIDKKMYAVAMKALADFLASTNHLDPMGDSINDVVVDSLNDQAMAKVQGLVDAAQKIIFDWDGEPEDIYALQAAIKAFEEEG